MPQKQNSKSVLDYLGTIGTTDKGDLQPKSVINELYNLAAFLIDEARNNLDKSGSMASGGTADSMRITNPKVNKGVYELSIEILSTYKFIDKGVRGTVSGTGKYKFKTSYPNKKMATAILKWVRKRGIASKYKALTNKNEKNARVGGLYNVGRNEAKNQRIKKMISESDNLKAMAYAISTNIKKKGIRKTNFFGAAVRETRKEMQKVLGKAFKVDIIQNLNNLN